MQQMTNMSPARTDRDMDTLTDTGREGGKVQAPVNTLRPSDPPTGAPAPTQTSKRRRRQKKSSGSAPYTTQSLPDQTTPDSLEREHLMKTVRLLGHSLSVVEEAAHRLQDSPDELTYDSLIDMAFTVQNEATAPSDVTDRDYTTEGGETPEQLAEGGEEQTGSGVDVESDSESQVVFQHKMKMAIERKKMELRSAIEALTFQCRVCNCSRATILLLPCGHLASCDDCLMDVRRCPINRCNKVVRGTKDVYFV